VRRSSGGGGLSGRPWRPLVGIDYLSIEPFQSPGHPTDPIFLRKGVVILEGLNLKENIMAEKESKVTTDPEEIRRWAEAHGGKPAMVKGTEILRMNFSGGAEEQLAGC
jgi:hypothetical protein